LKSSGAPWEIGRCWRYPSEYRPQPVFATCGKTTKLVPEAAMRISLTMLVGLVCVGPLLLVHAQNKTKAPGAQDILAGTIAALETDGLLHAEQVDKTRTSIEQKASQKLNKRRSRQIYFVHVRLLDGAKIEAFAMRDNSSVVEESGLVIYVVSKVLQPDGKPEPQP
jgi:hypothetical protein